MWTLVPARPSHASPSRIASRDSWVLRSVSVSSMQQNAPPRARRRACDSARCWRKSRWTEPVGLAGDVGRGRSPEGAPPWTRRAGEEIADVAPAGSPHPGRALHAVAWPSVPSTPSRPSPAQGTCTTILRRQRAIRAPCSSAAEARGRYEDLPTATRCPRRVVPARRRPGSRPLPRGLPPHDRAAERGRPRGASRSSTRRPPRGRRRRLRGGAASPRTSTLPGDLVWTPCSLFKA